jgi:hypothetical protein
MSMNCQECRAELIESARREPAGPPPLPIAGHLEVCADCSVFLDGQFALQSAFASLVAQTAQEPAPKELEAKMIARFDTAQTGSRRLRRWFPARAAALAASLAVAAFLLHRPAPVPEPKQDEPFVQIPYVVPPAPYERTQVMRMDVPVTALIAAGFEVHVADPGASVLADVLVGQDGRAHAIRLVTSSIPNPDRRLSQ